MLLPSSIGAGPRPRMQRFAAYDHENNQQLSSPPATPTTPQGIGGACMALQSALGTRSSATTPRSPRQRHINSSLHANARVLKRPPPRTRGYLKRTREDEASSTEDEDMSDDEYGISMSMDEDQQSGALHASEKDAPSTPKRRRRGPTSVPFGLARSDFVGMDEALDERMLDDASDFRPPPLDEGYGSMDIQVGPEGDMFANLKPLPRPQLSTSFFAPPKDSDVMSMSTPASDSNAMALSPAYAMSDSQSTTPDPMPAQIHPPAVKVTSPDEIEQPLNQDPELPEVLLPNTCTTLPPRVQQSKFTQGYFRPRPNRSPSQIHSDPIEYHRPAGASSHAPSPLSQTVYDWTDADDKALVDIVLDKLKLKKGDWDDCARLIGADNGASLGRRWRELVGDGCIGLKFRYSTVGFTAEDESRSGRGKVRRGKGGRGDVRAVKWT